MPRPIRQPLSIYAGLRTIHVAPYGDDANDGYDFRYPKQFILSAYDSLGAEGGYLMIMDGSYVGGEVPGQGIRLTNGPLYPGWRVAKQLQMFGYGQALHDSNGLFSYPMARIFPGRPGDVTKPTAPFDALIWITNSNYPFLATNLLLKNTSIGIRLAVNGDPTKDPFENTVSQRGVDQTVSNIFFYQCCVQNDGSGHDVGEGPAVDMGYSLFTTFEHCSLNVPTDNAKGLDRRAAFLSKAGPDASGQFKIINCRGSQGGVKFYRGASAWGIDIDDYLIESDNSAMPPGLHVVNADGNGRVIVKSLQIDDSGPGSDPQIVIDGTGTSSMILLEGSSSATARTAFGAVCLGVQPSATFAATDFQSTQKSGFVAGKLWGDTDAGRFAQPVVSSRYRNFCPQHADDGGVTGPLTPQPAFENGVTIYTAAGATGPHGVDSPVLDRWGGTAAWKIKSSSGDIAEAPAFNAAIDGCQVGDRFLAGVWCKCVGGMPPSGQPAVLSLTASPSPTIEYKLSDSDGAINPIFTGDGEWQWLRLSAKVLNLNGGSGRLGVKWALNGYEFFEMHYCGAVLQYIPVGDGVSDNEFASMLDNLPAVGQAGKGMATTQIGQKLLAHGGLAVGNYQAISGHVIGAVNGFTKVYDAEGNLLGVVEIKTLTS